MITITVTLSGDEIRRVDVRGHGGERKGGDIVCAAVSAVTQTALSGLLHYGKKSVTHDIRNGSLSIEIKKTPDARTRDIFSIILNTLVLGLKGIEGEHPRRVRVEVETK